MPKALSASPHLLTIFSREEIKTLFYTAQPIFKASDIEIRASAKTLPYGRILLVTPRKIGNAPQRNVLRRRLRAIFYEERLFEGPFDVIILAKPGIIRRSFQELKHVLCSALEKRTSLEKKEFSL